MRLYLAGLTLTLLLEVPTAVLLLGRGWRRRTVLAALTANLCSHPALHFLWPTVISPRAAPGLFILSGELAVLLFEATFYWAVVRPRPWSRALTASAAANLLSFLVGLLLFAGPAR